MLDAPLHCTVKVGCNGVRTYVRTMDVRAVAARYHTIDSTSYYDKQKNSVIDIDPVQLCFNRLLVHFEMLCTKAACQFYSQMLLLFTFSLVSLLDLGVGPRRAIHSVYSS